MEALSSLAPRNKNMADLENGCFNSTDLNGKA